MIPGCLFGVIKVLTFYYLFNAFYVYTVFIGLGATVVLALISWGGWTMADSWIVPYWASISRTDVGNWSAIIMKIYQTAFPLGILTASFIY